MKERYRQSTLDNRNTFPQVEYLADVYRLTKDERYKVAVLKGLDYLLSTQNQSGGWRGWDVDAITFNDEVTTGALELFLKITQGDESFDWVSSSLKEDIANAYQLGLEAILKCQIVQNGVKTAWGQQHDHITYQSVKARSYELPGITANESCDVILFLMNIPNPSDEIVESVKDAIAWLKRSEIKGIRVERISLSNENIINHEYPYDNVVVEDSEAKPIWARYYELSDNTPFMCTRAGQKVWTLSDVNAERRTGYEWYGYWPMKVLKKYDTWIINTNKSGIEIKKDAQ